MSNVLDNSEKVFSATEFRDAWLLLLSKGHNPARNLELFNVTSADGVERFNVGINCLATGRVIFPARSHDNISHAFVAISIALEEPADNLELCNHNCETYYTADGNVCGDCGEQLGD